MKHPELGQPRRSEILLEGPSCYRGHLSWVPGTSQLGEEKQLPLGVRVYLWSVPLPGVALNIRDYQTRESWL